MFQGFDEETIAFLWGIGLNNDRGWFEAHKEQYLRHVYDPLKALGADVFDALHAEFPREELLCKVSRIYRDARRLHGRGPYKDHLWFCIRREGEEWTERPTFWLEIGPTGYSCGMGFYTARAETMERFRRELDEAPGRFEPLAKRFAKQTRFTLTGPEYARKKGHPGGVLEDWYNRKYIALERESPYDETSFRPDFSGLLAEEFASLMPCYHYFDEFCRRGGR